MSPDNRSSTVATKTTLLALIFRKDIYIQNKLKLKGLK